MAGRMEEVESLYYYDKNCYVYDYTYMDNKRRKGKRREKVTSKAICIYGVVDITLLAEWGSTRMEVRFL